MNIWRAKRARRRAAPLRPQRRAAPVEPPLRQARNERCAAPRKAPRTGGVYCEATAYPGPVVLRRAAHRGAPANFFLHGFFLRPLAVAVGWFFLEIHLGELLLARPRRRSSNGTIDDSLLQREGYGRC